MLMEIRTVFIGINDVNSDTLNQILSSVLRYQLYTVVAGIEVQVLSHYYSPPL